MAGNQVMPVRAWAEYPEWSVYIEQWWTEDWYRVDIPKGANHGLRILTQDDTRELLPIPSLVAALAIEMSSPYGPLQSLRVLLSNGETLTLGRANDWWWYWTLSDPPQIGGYADGGFEDDNDAEAVQRALTAAAAYFNPTREGE